MDWFLYDNSLLHEKVKNVKSRNKNSAMAWIDYKKVYDMVPHSWIIECLDYLLGITDNINSLLVNSLEKWKVMLCSGNSELGEVEIKHGTFQFFPFSVCFSINSIKFDFKKGESSI